MNGPPPTLQYLADSDVQHIEAYCDDCLHHAPIPLATLIAKHGPTLEFRDLVGLLRCSQCGSKRVDPRPNYWDRDAPGLAKGWNVEG